MECKGCRVTIFQFSEIVKDNLALFEFLKSHNVLRRSLICPECVKNCKLNEENTFVCQEIIDVEGTHKIKNIGCPFSASLFKGTWFSKDDASVKDICIFTLYWVTTMWNTKHFMSEMNWTKKKVLKWLGYCQELCITWVNEVKKKIGGVGQVVEISINKIGEKIIKNKQYSVGQMVLGGLERENKEIFLEIIKDKTKKTLLTALQKWVLPGTTIMSNNSEDFSFLTDEGYKHYAVKRTRGCGRGGGFTDPVTGAHTRNLFRVWDSLKMNLPHCTRTEKQLEGYLAEFQWKRSVSDDEKKHRVFVDLIAKMYNPYAEAVEESIVTEEKEDEVSSSNSDSDLYH